MQPLLEAQIQSLVYPEETVPALTGIDLNIYPGQFIVLDGPSESGKSTLCRCLAGVIPHFERAHIKGEVRFGGDSLARMRLPEVAGKIGLVRDEPDNQLFSTRVAEDLAFGPCNVLLQKEEVEERVEQALRVVDLEGFGERQVETLSGGEMGRAALAATLTLHPRLIILDRAADMFDPTGRAAIYNQLRAMCRNENAAVLVVDNMVDDILPESDRVLVMVSGSIIVDGHPRVVSDRPDTLARSSLSSRLRAGAKSRSPTRDFGSRSVVQLKNVSFAYQDGKFALRDISLNIYELEFVAILGNNGAGKTTLAKLLNGLLKPHNGTVAVNGIDTTQFSTAQLSTHVGFLSQHPSLQICANSVREEVGFALKVRGVCVRETKQKVDKMLKSFGLTDVAEEHPYRLSRSRLQLVALASCMIAEPSILVIDEPTSRMTYPHNWETMDIIARFNREGGTVIMVAHDLELADYFCSRTLVMENGGIVSDVTKQTVPSTLQRSCLP